MRNLLQQAWSAAILAAALFATGGCTPHVVTKPKSSASATGHGHDHPHEGPHGGALVEWGDEEYHAEFTVDHGKKQATVYILDGSAKKPAPIKVESITLVIMNVKPPATVTLKADPQKDDPASSASRFVGQHDALGKEMEFEGEISGKVGEKPYAGDFKEEAHDHKHEHKK